MAAIIHSIKDTARELRKRLLVLRETLLRGVNKANLGAHITDIDRINANVVEPLIRGVSDEKIHWLHIQQLYKIVRIPSDLGGVVVEAGELTEFFTSEKNTVLANIRLYAHQVCEYINNQGLADNLKDDIYCKNCAAEARKRGTYINYADFKNFVENTHRGQSDESQNLDALYTSLTEWSVLDDEPGLTTLKTHSLDIIRKFCTKLVCGTKLNSLIFEATSFEIETLKKLQQLIRAKAPMQGSIEAKIVSKMDVLLTMLVLIEAKEPRAAVVSPKTVLSPASPERKLALDTDFKALKEEILGKIKNAKQAGDSTRVTSYIEEKVTDQEYVIKTALCTLFRLIVCDKSLEKSGKNQSYFYGVVQPARILIKEMCCRLVLGSPVFDPNPSHLQELEALGDWLDRTRLLTEDEKKQVRTALTPLIAGFNMSCAGGPTGGPITFARNAALPTDAAVRVAYASPAPSPDDSKRAAVSLTGVTIPEAAAVPMAPKAI
jgi:hypothetical protein